jgi:hypothetical protein
VKPLILIERRLDEVGGRVQELDGFCRIAALRQMFGALWSGSHRNSHFTIFDGARKRLQRLG